MITSSFHTPLRYPGGKGRLTNFVQKIIACNELLGGTYVEPFAGGAGIAISLLLKGFVSKIVLNDADISIYRLWKSITEHNDELIEAVRSVDLNIDEWERQHEIQLHKEKHSTFDTGFSTLYLNRTNRSGILLAGPIGGKSQNGKYKLDARFNREDIITRVKAIGDVADRIDLYCSDASYLLQSYLPQEYAQDNTLIYIDPPYYEKGSSLYMNHYDKADHEELSNIIKNLDFKWLLSYDDVPEIRKMYDWSIPHEFDMHHHADLAHIGHELFYSSKDLLIDDIVITPKRIRFDRNRYNDAETR